MPRLTQTTTATAPRVEFVVSVPLDLMNAMFFTGLVPQIEGVDGWPEQVRREMAPDLLAELDFLCNYPAGDPAVMGILGENLFAHRDTWAGVDQLLRYIGAMPAGVGESASSPGIQGLVYHATFRYLDEPERQPYEGLPPREAIEGRVRSLGDRDAAAVMALYDRPEELRQRMVRLVQRFYEEHYRHDLPRRMACLERSAARHRNEPVTDVVALTKKLTGRPKACIGDVCAGPFQSLVFVPSLDMGPYISCADLGSVHGLYYHCEPEPAGEAPEAAAETARLARIYRALADEQRLRILGMLREREMYAQEIVERTGLHQPVVSRHLTFMKAVGLVLARRQNNMKFFSLNPAMREELSGTLELFAGAGQRE